MGPAASTALPRNGPDKLSGSHDSTISMAKRNNVKIAQNIAREARQILGGMGITRDFSIMRHMINLETLVTYQGTNEMHILITGQDITGINAF